MSNHLSESPKIMHCSCTHEYQDKEYGQQKRVHNPCKDGDKTKYRCTVCGKEKGQSDKEQ